MLARDVVYTCWCAQPLNYVGDWSSGGVRLMDLNGSLNGQMDTMDGQEDVELEWELV